jgi:hypothetical protein
VKARLIEQLPRDPQVMRIVASKPELIVAPEPQIITVDGSTQKDGSLDCSRRDSLIAESGRNRRRPSAQDWNRRQHRCDLEDTHRVPEEWVREPQMRGHVPRRSGNEGQHC